MGFGALSFQKESVNYVIRSIGAQVRRKIRSGSHAGAAVWKRLWSIAASSNRNTEFVAFPAGRGG